MSPTLRSCAVLIGWMVALSTWAWFVLPDDCRIPVHFGPDFEPDRYAGKSEGLWLVPMVAAVAVVVLEAAPRFDPRGRHVRQSAGAYGVVRVAVTGFFALLHTAVVLQATGVGIAMDFVLPVGLGLLFIVMGNLFGKIRSNFFFGVRTPWTLSSELAWNKTHRLCGRLFVILGLGFVGVGLLRLRAVGLVLVGGLFAIVAVAFVYSYFVWRSDPDRSKVGR